MANRILRRAGDTPSRSVWTKIKDLALTDVGALARTGAIQGSLETLEEVLLEADFGGGNAGSDPAAVAFDAVDAGISRGKDVVIVDTAGRLHTSGSLLEEMKKINRVIGKRLPGAPHETLLVLDGTIGQNAVAQARTFSEAIRISGLVVTKLDGTAKGGIVLAVHEALNVPVKFIGIGEKASDLDQFDPKLFAREVLEQ